MAESQPRDGLSSLDVSGESSESALQLNIKTLDSRIYSFHVDKNIPVLAFKEKIAIQSGVPVGQQRLIFRGKVLKDNHLLSEYNVENGDTFHLVERQLQPSPGTGEATSSNRNRAQDSNVGGRPQNRIGPISHSIVLGSLNVGDPGEAVVPDLSQVIGAVLNTIGIGNQAGGMQPGVPVISHGNERDMFQANGGSQNQGANQFVPLQALYGQSASDVMQIPPRAAIAVPSLNMPIPDSMNTLMEFMNQMQLAFSQNGEQPNQSTTSSYRPAIELPSNGFPTVEAMSIVLQHAQHLLSDHAAPALSHTAGRLNQERGSNDLVVREQLQTESVQLGRALQHLGALLLELGRTILTLRMGRSPAESFVYAGPSVYISPLGPNPIMVQPFPLQTSSLFGGSSAISPNPVAVGPVGVSSVPRNVNIHIHTGASPAPIASVVGDRSPNGEGILGEHVNVTGSGDSDQARGLLGINVSATAAPSPPTMVSVSGAVPPGSGVRQTTDSNSTSSIIAEITDLLRQCPVANMQSEHAQSGQPQGSTNQEQGVGYVARDGDTSRHSSRAGETSHTSPHFPQTTDSDSTSSMVAEINALLRQSLVANMQSGHAQSGLPEGSTNQEQIVGCVARDGDTSGQTTRAGETIHTLPNENKGNDNPDCSSGIPLGLGLRGLQPMVRGKHSTAQSKDGDSASTCSQNQQSRAVGRQVLQSLALNSTGGTTNSPPSGESPDLAREVGTQNAYVQGDVADAMSQILHSPDLDGLLAGVSQQTEVGSPDMLRNMLQQFTQSPAMRNTVNQIAQQIDSHDLGSMFSSLDSGPDAGIDLSRMMQQMMPIVSKVLGGVPSVSQSTPSSDQVLPESISRRDMMTTNGDTQRINLQQVVQRLEDHSSSEEVFCSVVDSVENSYADGSAVDSVVNQLLSQRGLAEEFMEMLRHDVSQRFSNRMGS